jgi:SAM-dependent methyltransferase
MARADEVRAYWDKKIVDWDDSSYSRDRPRSLLARLRSSVDARMKIAMDLLRPHVAGKSVLDLGCGGGRLTVAAVKALGAARAHGIDISQAGVERGRQLAESAGVADRVTFEAGSVTGHPLPPADVTLGLGLFDWLNDDETDALLRELHGRRILLSYSEKDWSLSEIIHRFYLIYPLALFGGQVRARHHRRQDVIALMGRHGFLPCEIIDRREARFGKLIHNLSDLRAPVPLAAS